MPPTLRHPATCWWWPVGTSSGPKAPFGALTLVTVPEMQRPGVRPTRQGGRTDLFLGTEKSVQCTADNHIGQAVDIKSVQYIARDWGDSGERRLKSGGTLGRDA